MLYSDELISEVLSANDIVDIISSYISLKRSGRGLVGLCPFHSEKTPSFSVSPDKQLYHCFGCGEGGSVLTFIMKMENLDFIEGIKFLADRAHIALPEPEMSESVDRHFKIKQRVPGVYQYTVALSTESHAPDPVPFSATSRDSGLLYPLWFSIVLPVQWRC